jgi:hypothetical protein
LDEGLQKIQNYNAIESLILVNQGQKTKVEVFDKSKLEYKVIFASLEELEKKRSDINAAI